MLSAERRKALRLHGTGTAKRLQFTFSWEADACPKCNRSLAVRATRSRSVISTTYGEFEAIEKEGYCPQHVHLPPARSQQLRRIVAPGTNHAYDVLVRVGLARFRQCRQGEEIRSQIAAECGVVLKLSTISYLARKFVAYVDVVHRESIALLRTEMKRRGGYVLHVDGSCDQGSRVLLVCMDSISGHVLESRKISSENHDEVKAVLEQVREKWGRPLGVVHDLRKALISAVAVVFHDVAQFVCHFHLAADIGRDILGPDANALRSLFRRSGIRPKLRALVRSLKSYAVCKFEDREALIATIIAKHPTHALKQHATPDAVKGTVHALASWILAFPADGEGHGFPFDMPYLSLYQRIIHVRRALAKLPSTNPASTAFAPVQQLTGILDILLNEDYAEDFRKTVVQTKADVAVFERLRRALRVSPRVTGKKKMQDAARPLSPKAHARILKQLRESLRTKDCGNVHRSRAAGIVVQHLDKYWPYLFGHLRKTHAGQIIVPRTNNCQESLFGLAKRQCRRLHGTSHLSAEIESMSPSAPLLLNLSNESYCKTVYGSKSPEDIAERFSYLDAREPMERLNQWKKARTVSRMPQQIGRMKNLPKRLVRFLTLAAAAT